MIKFADFKQGKIRYSDTGSGRVVVFLHGFLESLEMWRYYHNLPNSIRKICIDLPGHGGFEPNSSKETYSVSNYKKYLLNNTNKYDEIILIGHSLGGYFCSYILPYQTSFKSLQIYDPSIWFSNGEAIHQIKSRLAKIKECRVFLSSSGNYKNQFAYHHKKIKQLNRTLRRFSNIEIDCKTYKNESHNSMYLHSFIDGMLRLYKNYDLRRGGIETKINVSMIDEHYKRFSKQIHFPFNPPNELYLEAGTANFHQKKYRDCVESLEQFLSHNSTNSYAFELLGDAYSILGNKEKGLDSYKKSYLIALSKRLEKKMGDLEDE